MLGASCLDWWRVVLNWGWVVLGCTEGDLSWRRVVLIPINPLFALSWGCHLAATCFFFILFLQNILNDVKIEFMSMKAIFINPFSYSWCLCCMLYLICVSFKSLLAYFLLVIIKFRSEFVSCSLLLVMWTIGLRFCCCRFWNPLLAYVTSHQQVS